MTMKLIYIIYFHEYFLFQIFFPFFSFFVCLGSSTTAVETAPPDISEESKTKDINDKTNDKDTKDDNHDVAEALLGSKEHKDQLNVDVKIGDGMDIAIHGENGMLYSDPNINSPFFISKLYQYERCQFDLNILFKIVILKN